MPELAELVTADTTAVLCHEMQRGVVGDLASPAFPTARAVADSGIVEPLARLLVAARARGIRVIHCAASFRRDRAGSFANAPLLMGYLDNPEHMLEGTPSVDPIPELWDPEVDIVLQRFHGFSSFAGTELDALLRSVGAATVVATGVSLNRGVTGLTIEAVNYGYRVVLPTDCSVGYPPEYGAMVLEHTLQALAWLSTADDVIACW